MIGLVDHDDKTSGPKIRFINLEQPGWKARFLDLASLGGLVMNEDVSFEPTNCAR